MEEGRTERRQDKRQRSLLGGHVVMNNRCSTMDCIVRDLGLHGARLRFGGAAFVPQEFELRINGRNEKRRARKIWTRDGDMGVRLD